MSIDDAKLYEAMLGKHPEFARIGEAASTTLYELCKLADTEAAYALGEQARTLMLQWIGIAVVAAFDAGKVSYELAALAAKEGGK